MVGCCQLEMIHSSLLKSFLLPLKFEDVSLKKTVTFKCASVQRLFFNGPEVHMVSFGLRRGDVLPSGICQKWISIFGAKQSDTAGCNVFKLLKNACMLRDLYVKKDSVTTENLELLHSKLKHLNLLKLEGVFMYYDSRAFDIEPGASVKKCYLYISSYDDSYAPYCQYISKKNTQLEELKIKIIELRIYANNEEEQGTILISYLKTLAPSLKTLKLVFVVDDIGGPDNEEEEEEDPDERLTGYFRFDMLDECGCEIEDIEIGVWLDHGTLYELSRTTQTQSIHSLTVNYMMVGVFDGFCFGWLRSFTTLTELRLSVDMPFWYEDK